jgi:hypothetical protein
MRAQASPVQFDQIADIARASYRILWPRAQPGNLPFPAHSKSQACSIGNFFYDFFMIFHKSVI